MGTNDTTIQTERQKMILKTLITNELKRILGREPTFNERKSAQDYIVDNFDYDKTALSDLPAMLEDWRANNCFKCFGCEKYYINDELYHHVDSLKGNVDLCKNCYWDESVAKEVNEHLGV